MLYLFLLGRILLGGYFIMNGWNHFAYLEANTGYAKSKGLPMAKASVMVSGAIMILGGLGILLWFEVQIATALLALFLAVVTFTMHQYWKITDPMARMGEQINFYKNLGLLGAVIIIGSIPFVMTAGY